MACSPSGAEIRQVVLEVVAEYSERGPGFQSESTLKECARRLRLDRTVENEQALLTIWSDLFRIGYLAWGYNLDNTQPPFVHATEPGRRALVHFGRDPANPDGYLAHLRELGPLGIAGDYISEALASFNAGAFRACAVMVGAAVESLLFDLAGDIRQLLQQRGEPREPRLDVWQVGRVSAAVQEQLQRFRSSMPAPLAEAFDIHWGPMLGHIRVTRNDAGHPRSLQTIPEDSAHATLLMFPTAARLTLELRQFVGLLAAPPQ